MGGARTCALGVAAAATLLLVPATAGATIAPKPLDTWQTNGRVLSILQIGSVTYVGGKFTQISDHHGDTRQVSNLAAFDAAGTPTSWTPTANGAVKALAPGAGGSIIVGGSFTKIDGKGRNHLAEIEPDGTLVPKATWGGAANGDVQALAVQGSRLYLGGTFSLVEGSARNFLAAVARSDGSLDASWTPTVDGRVDGLAANSSRVVAGGFFTTVEGQSQASLAGLDPASGDFQPGFDLHRKSPVVAMAQRDGDGSIYAGTANNRLTAFDTSGSKPPTWETAFDGNVQAVVFSDGEVVAGGHFDNLCDVGTNCDNPIVRHHIAALDPANGDLDTSWAPSVNSDLGVFALADTSTGLAVGGDFTRIGGVDQAHLAWMATGSSVPVDSAPPTITLAPDAVLRKATTISHGRIPMLVRWAATDPSGVCAYHLERSVGGDPYAPVTLATASATSKHVTPKPSTASVRYRVSATDCVGNTSSLKTGTAGVLAAVQDTSARIAYTRAWKRVHAGKAYGDTVHVVSRAGATARFAFTGRQVAWVASRLPGRGVARVYLDGELKAKVNLHSATRMRRRIVFARTWSAAGEHHLAIVCAGTSGHPKVDVDAILTVR
jgi:Domain of unknown function (DUF5122) beta-propeller